MTNHRQGLFFITSLVVGGMLLTGCAKTTPEMTMTSEEKMDGMMAMEQKMDGDAMMHMNLEGLNGNYTIDAENSLVTWHARKVTAAHDGNIKISSGSVAFENGLLTQAEFVMDMKTITDNDLSNESMNAMLVNHLKSADFFDVETHPTSMFKMANVEKSADGSFMITGDLTMRGITKSVSFPVQIVSTENGVQAKGTITVEDRTMYDLKFRSGKLFSDLGDTLISDDFTIDFDVVANQ